MISGQAVFTVSLADIAHAMKWQTNLCLVCAQWSWICYRMLYSMQSFPEDKFIHRDWWGAFVLGRPHSNCFSYKKLLFPKDQTPVCPTSSIAHVRAAPCPSSFPFPLHSRATLISKPSAVPRWLLWRLYPARIISLIHPGCLWLTVTL